MTALSTPVAGSPHTTATSSGTGNVVSQTQPPHAAKMIVTVKGASARITFDGTTPVPGTPVGLCLPAGVYTFDCAARGTSTVPGTIVVQHAADTAASCEVSILWLT